MVAAMLVAAPAATAFLLAASLRLPSLVSTLLAAYLAFVANLGAVTWALSPFQAVTRGGLGGVEALLLVAALLLWLRRGRPAPSLRAARTAARELRAEPVALVYLAAVAVLLAYELTLALTAPPNNWDSLTYHLPRAAAWFHHHGIYWIANPPSPNFNEFPPLAEQQILYLFVATGRGALFALPQYLAELAVLVAVYGTARRLGFTVRTAACASCLLATFSFFALQATTAQNDLFAASFPVVAACLILGGSRLEFALGGAAAAIGLSAKPTTALVLPVLAVLAAVRGRRAFVNALVGAAAGFVGVGMWTYVVNAIHTGSIFGSGGWTQIGAANEQPVRGGSISHALDLGYQLLDVAVFTDGDIRMLWIAGAVAAVLAGLYALRTGPRNALIAAVGVAVPFLAPLLVIHAGDVVAYLARSWKAPVRGSLGNVGGLNREIGGASFGALGSVALYGVPLLTLVTFLRRRVDARALVLALAMPLFLVLLSHANYNWFLIRFFITPAALCAPLFAQLFSRRLVPAAFLVVSTLSVALVVTQDPLRPLHSRFGRPWNFTQVQAAELSDRPAAGLALASYERLVPARACVGAVLDPNEPAYLLSGPGLEHAVVYLSVDAALEDAYRHGLFYVVITTGQNSSATRPFAAAGWKIRSLAGYWQLATAPHATAGGCTV